MKVAIRADASIAIGSGHVMRCLTLADGLRQVGADIVFLCRELEGHLATIISDRGYSVHVLPPRGDGQTSINWQDDAAQSMQALGLTVTFDWVVVDHYGLEARWETAMRSCARHIMAIDDLANRPHDCDLLLDQNYYRGLGLRYAGLVPRDCRKLLGPDYALLRPEFREERLKLRSRDGMVRRILICFGGADPDNLTAKAIEAVSSVAPSGITVDVVIGANNPHRKMLSVLCREQSGVTLHVQAGNMAELIAASDLGIGAGGATTWERCILGLPTLTVVFATNQEQTTLDLSQAGAIRYLGWGNKLSVTELADAIHAAMAHPQEMQAMSRRAMQLMDGFMLHDRLPAVSALLGESREGCSVEHDRQKIN